MAGDEFESEVLGELRLLRGLGDRLEQRLQEMQESLRFPSGSVPFSDATGRKTPPPTDEAERQQTDMLDSPSGIGMQDLCSRATHASRISQQSIELLHAMEPSPKAITPPEISPKGCLAAPSLPVDWPQVLQMRRELCVEPMNESVLSTMRASSKVFALVRSKNTDVEAEGQISRFVLDPSSKISVVYAITSMLVLCMDLTMLPYVLAWDVEFSGFFFVLGWITPIFWTIDIGMSFSMSYYEHGELVCDRRRIARHYTRSWFLVDTLIVTFDWASLVTMLVGMSGGDTSNLKMLRFAKLGKLLRAVGMIRMVRLARTLEEMAKEFAAKHVQEGSRLAFRLATLVCGILWLAHVMACLWFVIGSNAPSNTGLSWVDQVLQYSGRPFDEFLDMPLLYQYMASLQWAMGMITLLGSPFYPTNSWEQIFYVGSTVFGFIFGSTLVSMMSAAMMDYQMMNKDRNMKLRILRQYLQENSVPSIVTAHVHRQVRDRLSQRDRLVEGDVVTLQLLSAALRSKLRYEIQRPYVCRHPIFRLWASMRHEAVHIVCSKAIDFANMRPKDDLFVPGNLASAAYVLVRGELVYTQYPESAPVSKEEVTEVNEGQWLCETALWVEWTHVGRAETVTSCQLLSVDAADFAECVLKDFGMREIAVEYGRQFHRRVMAARPPQGQWPTDLHVPFTDYCDLVVSMDKAVQSTLGQLALSQLHNPRGGSSAMEKLRREVDDGKSIVGVTGEGSIIRVVSLVVLRARNGDGHVFMQVGKWTSSETRKHALQLPGLKQEADEQVTDTLDRLFQERLSFLAEKLKLSGVEREMTEKESKEYGVHTRYLRSIFAADLVHGGRLEVPRCSQLSHNLSAGSMAVRPMQTEGRVTVFDINGAERYRASLDPTQRQILDLLEVAEVYAVPADGGGESGNLYAWLPEDAVGALGSSGGDKVLRAWISQLVLPSFSETEHGSEDDEEDGSSFGMNEVATSEMLSECV